MGSTQSKSYSLTKCFAECDHSNCETMTPQKRKSCFGCFTKLSNKVGDNARAKSFAAEGKTSAEQSLIEETSNL